MRGRVPDAEAQSIHHSRRSCSAWGAPLSEGENFAIGVTVQWRCAGQYSTSVIQPTVMAITLSRAKADLQTGQAA